MFFGLLLMYSLTVFVSASSSDDCPRKCDCSQSNIINCIGGGLKTMPKRISRDMERFLADENEITELPSRMLINGVSLQRLTISRNSVGNLKTDNFVNTQSLIYLDLSYNNITLVPEKAFFGLTSLRILKLDSNQITHISPSAFEHLSSLRELYLSENRIESLTEGLFTSLGQLQSLRLDGNGIATIPRGIFRSMPGLVILNLSRNRIRSISTGAFGGLKALQKLLLHDNQIEKLDTHLPMSNTSCDTKGVGTSSLAEIVRPPSGQRGAFENLRELRMLDLRHNELRFISPASFFGLRQLRTLYLGGNLWRCNCALKWSLEALQRVGHRHDFVQGAIICNTPIALKDFNLLQLGFEDIERISNNSRLTETINHKETDSNGYNQWNVGHRRSATTTGPLRDGATFAPHGDRSTSIRYERRPSNDLMTQYYNVRPSAVSRNIKATSRSLISTPQIGSIARTTSFVFNHRGSKWGSGVNQRNKPTIRNHITDDQRTNDKNNAGVTHNYQPGVEIGERDGGRGVITKKEKKRSETWLLPTAIALLVLAVFASTSVVVQFMTRRNKSSGCCPKTSKSNKNASIRYVTSNPLLYDSHHFVSRPLPQAPRPLRQNVVATDEVRWTNGGVYGLRSNRSSFASLQNHTVTESLSNAEQNNHLRGAANDTQRPRFAEPMPNRNPNIYSYVETAVPATRMLDQRPPLMPPTTQHTLHPDDFKLRKTMEIRKRMEERRKRRRVLLEMTKASQNSIDAVSTACGNTENKTPPPPPRRNDSSKIRCQELSAQNRIKNPVAHFPEYCEIDRLIPKQIVRAEYREKQSCKTNVEKILVPHIDGDQSGEERVNSKSVMQVHRTFRPVKSCNQENHWRDALINPGSANHDIPQPFLHSQYVTKHAKPRDHRNKIQSSKYDRLFFRDQAPNTIEMIREDFSPESSRSNLLLDDMNAPDSCFKNAEDDFVISFPRVTTRRSCPGGLFGSDQHILDSLRQQDLGIYKPRHHTAPSGLQDLTVPLSEFSTDEDEECDVFRKDSQGLPSSAGSLSAVLARTLDSNDDVFVYTMAGEAPTEIIPKIVINDGLEDEYETVGDEFVDHEKNAGDFVSDDDTSHQYHHLQFMYSGFSGDNKSPRQKENTTSLRVYHKEESSSHRNWKNFQKNLKRRRRERHYYSIDPGCEPREEYDNVLGNSEKKTLGSKKPARKERNAENENLSRISAPKEVIYASRESEIYSRAYRGNNEDDVDLRERVNGGETIFKSEQDGAKTPESDSEINTDGNKHYTPESVEEILRQCCSANDERLSRKKHRQRPEAYCFIKLDENKNPIVKIRLAKNSTNDATEIDN